MHAQACRAAGDLDEAWRIACRYREAAARVGGHMRPYYAARKAIDIALDRADLPVARELLGELGEHAAALDAITGTATYTTQAARRRARLAGLEKAPPWTLERAVLHLDRLVSDWLARIS